MTLENLKKNKKRNKIIINSILGILLIIGSILLYKTYAFYEEKKSFNVLKGRIPDFGYDIKLLSVMVDENRVSTIPERGLYKTNVHCTNGTFGEWDYNNWNLALNNVSEQSKCNVEFTSRLSEEEYNKYIEAGKALHRNTYRGKDITEYYTDGSLYTRISNGTFEDIYVGDYIVANEVTWLIADIDNYLHTGDAQLNKHHATIIPAKPIMNVPMNATDTTEGGYANSKMATETLPNLVSNEGVIGKTFGSHILEYRNLLSKHINSNAINQSGGVDVGASNEWAGYTRKIDLMSETNVYGTIVYSSSGIDTGIDSMQYAIFALKPEIRLGYNGIGYNYWLKNVASSRSFAYVNGQGISQENLASQQAVVRPRFLIG